jgi:hypothetical protein
MKGPLAPSHPTDPDTLARGIVQRAHHRDGLPELFAGVGFLIGSGMCWSDTLPSGSRMRTLSSLASTLLVMAFCLASGRLMNQVRQRFLLDRVGYVRMKANRPMLALSLVIALVVGIVIVLGIRQMHSAEPAKWLIVLVGALAGLFQVSVGRSPRFWFTGAFSLTAAFAIATSRLSFSIGMGIYFVLVGILEIVVGAVVLSGLLRQPVRDEF